MGFVSTEYNRIKISGEFGPTDLKITLAAYHNLTTKSGYSDIELDFSEATKLLAPEMVPFCATIRHGLHDGIDTSLLLPNQKRLERLFVNTNWAYLIDPRRYEKANASTRAHLPAQIFNTADDQQDAVNETIEILLGSLSDATRGQIAALEWSINEITDNVLNHAESKIGGIMQVTLDLSRFCSVSLNGIIAIKENNYGTQTQR